MAFAVGNLKTNSNLKMIDEEGKEHFGGKDNMDTSHLRLLDEQAQQEAGPKDEAAPSPLDAVEKFTTAMGEMDVVIHLITNLENARYLDYRILANKQRSNVSAIQDAVNDRLVRMGCRRAALASAAERLSKGAVALRAVARRDATYYSQVTALQRFWRIRVNPPTSAFAGAPFSAEVVFAEPTATTAATGAAAGGAGGSAGQATKGGAGRAGAGGGTGDGGDAGSSGLSPAQQLIMTVPLYKDPVTGEVRAQVEREEGPEAVALRASLLLAPSPTITNVSSVGEGEGGQQGTTGLPGQEDSEAAAGQGGGGQSLGKPSAGAAGSKAKADPGMDVAVGARDVHALLLGLQQRLLWMVVARGLEQDAAQGRGQAPITPFTHSLARKVMSHLSKGPSLSLPTQTQAQHPQLEPGSTIGMDVDEGSVSRLASSLPAASYTAAWRASADVLALRPLALEHAVMCRVPAATIHLHPRPYTTPLHALPLLPDLSAAISHAHFRACLRQHLAVQAHEVRSVALHWAPTTRAATSAIRVCVRPNSQFLVIMQGSDVEVEGVGIGGVGAASRWARDSVAMLQRTDLPRLVHLLLGVAPTQGASTVVAAGAPKEGQQPAPGEAAPEAMDVS